MIRIRREHALALLVSVHAFGCISLGTLQRANTAGKGNVQFGLEPVAFGTVVPTKPAATPSNSTAATNVSSVVPSLGGSVRYGVTDTIDIGGRLSFAGLEITTKFQLVAPTSEGGVFVSIAPGIGGIGLGAGNASFGIFNVEVPVLIGIPMGPHQLVLAPKVQELVVFATSGADATGGGITFIGATVGAAFKLGDGFNIIPEFGLSYPVFGAAGNGTTSSSTVFSSGNFFYQVGVGFVFGGR